MIERLCLCILDQAWRTSALKNILAFLSFEFEDNWFHIGVIPEGVIEYLIMGHSLNFFSYGVNEWQIILRRFEREKLLGITVLKILHVSVGQWVSKLDERLSVVSWYSNLNICIEISRRLCGSIVGSHWWGDISSWINLNKLVENLKAFDLI